MQRMRLCDDWKSKTKVGCLPDWKVVIMKKEHLEMLKSWAKVFGAGVVALAIAGERDPKSLLAAGVAAVLPVVYNYLDPKDPRYGKVIKVQKKAAKKAAPRKKVK